MDVRTVTRSGVEHVDWEGRLGKTLPVPGYRRVRWWLIVPSLLVLLALLVMVGVVAWWFIRPAVALELESHPTLRQAALAWRERYTADPRGARSLQIWNVSQQKESRYAVVLPLSDDGSKEQTRSGGRGLFDAPRARWSLTLEQLDESRQSATLGEERLSRGTVLVMSSGNDAAPRLFASVESPPDGYEQKADLQLVGYEHCLPRLEPALAGAQLSTPMKPAAPKGNRVYWLARELERVTVIETEKCGEPPIAQRQSGSTQVLRQSVPLLSFDERVDKRPFVLVLPEPGAIDAAPQLFKLPVSGKQRLEAQSLLRGAAAPDEASELYDSFEDGVNVPGEAIPVARRGSKGKPIEYLVRFEEAWRFMPCAAPQSNTYRVENSTCDALKGTRLMLGPQHIKPENKASEGGWNLWGWSQDGNDKCDIRVVDHPCEKN